MSAATAMSDAERKLRYARSVVVQAHPFFAALLLSQRLVETQRIPTMATDGKHLYFNPDWVLSKPADELHGTCAHEALHPGFCHHVRRGKRAEKRWNEACDLVINPILLDAGFKLPAGALYRDDCRGMDAEQVYAKLEAENPPPPPQQPTPDEEGEAEEDAESEARGDDAGQPDDDDTASGASQDDGNGEAGAGDEGRFNGQDGQDGQGNGQPQQGAGEGGLGGDTDGPAQDDRLDQCGDVGGCGWVMDGQAADGAEEDRQNEEAEWKQRMATAAMHAAGTMPGSLRDAVRELLDPRADWRDLLRRYMNTLSKSDQSWSRQNRRFIASGTYLPAMYDETIGRVAFVCDVSASMPRGVAQRALSEVAAICTEIRPEGLDVVFFDTRVTASAQYEVGDEPVTDALIPGGGGTTFNTAYDWLDESGEQYSVVVFLTDLYPNDPWETHRVPDCPLLWVDYCDGSVVPPYGDEVVRMAREMGNA